MKYGIISFIYSKLLKPILFLFDAEKVHNAFTVIGSFLGKYEITRKLLCFFLLYSDQKLSKKICHVVFTNSIGLAAGFDYNGYLARTMKYTGFGFNTVGTVTARPYKGNHPPRLGRLPNSRSLLVNKGFKSLGADKVYDILSNQDLEDSCVGLSVGSSNLSEVYTIEKAIEDYLYTFAKFKDASFIKYFELNISCPNLAINEPFSKVENFHKLLQALRTLKIKKPIFVKMPNEIAFNELNQLCDLIIKFKLQGVILSNLIKNRENKYLTKKEVQKIKDKRGSFSGKPCHENALKLVKHTKQKYGNDLVLIGCGGVFGYEDAKEFFDAGANLIQLITGMIFEGPQISSEINKQLSSTL